MSRYHIGGETPALVIDHSRGVYAEGDPLTKATFTTIATFTRASVGYAKDAQGAWQEFPVNAPKFSWATGKRAHLIEAADAAATVPT